MAFTRQKRQNTKAGAGSLLVTFSSTHRKERAAGSAGRLWTLKASPSDRLYLPKLRSAPSTGDQMFKYMSLWELLLIQTVSEGLVKQILAPELRPWLDGRYGLDMWRLRGRLSLPSMTAWL